MAAEMEESGFEDIGTYVTMRQNNITQYIATQPILDHCDWSSWSPGVWVFQW